MNQLCYNLFMKNPFIYSDDNKRYHTFNYYLKHRFSTKVFKVPLNASFTCPNRDGTCGVGGCTFCSSKGSGDTVHDAKDLMEQFEKGKEMMLRKWPNGQAMAYFQAYTNTYGSLEQLQACFEPFMEREDVLGICIATRADCLNESIVAYLDSLAKRKEVWIEVGLQTIHNETALAVNRGHTYECFEDAIHRLAQTDCKICVHLMNGLPYETKEMMIASAKKVGQLPIHAVKIHMLHLLKHTKMGNDYLNQPFPLLSKEEYVAIICEQLKVLPKEIVIERLTGDGILSDLIAPDWTIKKVCVLNDIDKCMALNNWTQGMLVEEM